MMEKRILFITSRNIITTSGELRLIKNRAESLYSVNSVSTDFLVLQSTKRLNAKNKETIFAGGITKEIGYSANVLKGIRAFKSEIKSLLGKREYDAVVFSGFYVTKLIPFVKKLFKGKIGLDIHGSIEDVLLLSSGKGVKQRIKARALYTYDCYLLRKYFKIANFAFVVTNELKEYVIKRFNPSKTVKFFVVPCAVNTISGEPDDYWQKRAEYRKKYHIDDNSIVFIYSGGVSKWQCLEETFDLAKKIEERIPESCFLFFSHNIDVVKKLGDGLKNAHYDSYSSDELGQALYSGDYAFMLRSDCITNNVAFPNKYLEYVKSGMKIITTPHLTEVSSQIIRNGIGFSYDFGDDTTKLMEYITKSKDKKPDFNLRKSILESNGFISRLEGFEAYLDEKDISNC